VLLNWVIIVAQLCHWFNPLIWAAMRRLRADRELVCDAIVLQHLDKADRRVYGGTLLKLLELLNQPIPSPALLSVLNHKHEIKRRIRMIPQFTSSKRVLGSLTVALMAILCALTFTRAAEQRKTPAVDPATARPGQTGATIDREAPTAQLKRKLQELDVRIAKQRNEVDQLRSQIGGLGLVEVGAESVSSSTTDPETIRLLERERITSESMAARYETLLNELKAKSPSQLAQALPTAVPDTELSSLLRDLNAAEAQLQKAGVSFGPENVQMKELSKTVETVRKQIDARVQGILSGLAAQVAAQKASADQIARQLDAASTRVADATARARPYFEAKHELMLLMQVRDSIMMQYLQKQFGTTE
jgi:uncharacterized coiled-coil protein SlyX